MFYYGRRTAKNCHPSDLFVTYFTSSEYVSQYIKTNGTPDVIDIRKIFTSTEKCMQWEERVLRKIDAPCNLKFLNKSYGDGKFSSTGMCLVRNLNGISEYTSVDDPRFLTGEIVGRAKGVKYSDEINSKKAVGRGKEYGNKAAQSELEALESIKKLYISHGAPSAIIDSIDRGIASYKKKLAIN